MLTEQKYKDMSVKEFTKAAGIYDSGHAGIYEMCKDDYPPVLKELKKVSFQDTVPGTLTIFSHRVTVVRVIGSKLLLYHFGIKAVIIPKYHGDTN